MRPKKTAPGRYAGATGANRLSKGSNSDGSTATASAASLDALIVRTRLSEVVRALGGPPAKRGRCPAWYRGGDNPLAVSIDDDGGRWYDHAAGKGGGVLDLIQAATGCNRKGAAAWLATFHGVALGRLDAGEARRAVERRRRAEARARALLEWRDRLILALRDARNTAWSGANQSDRIATGGDPDDPATWALVAGAVERRHTGDAIGVYAAKLKEASPAQLLALKNKLEQRPLEIEARGGRSAA